MKVPNLKLNEIYYVFTFGLGGAYVKFYTQFLKKNQNNNVYFAKISKNFDYTKPFIENEDFFKSYISLLQFNNSIVIHESQFNKYSSIIKIPALNLSRKQTEFYKRELLLDNIINNI